MLERDMYEPVRNWLRENGFEPRAEVRGCDIMAVRDDTVLAVELKTSLNLEVILQAVDRQRFSDIVYIAVPKKGRLFFTRRWRQICHLIRRLEIGLLLVSINEDGASVKEMIAPVPFDRVKSRQMAGKKRIAAVKEYSERHGDRNVGGSTRSRLVTAYRERAIFIASLLAQHGPMSPKALREHGADREKTLGILRNNHYGWFENVSRGLYGITDAGRNALAGYGDLVAELRAGYEASKAVSESESAGKTDETGKGYEKKRKRNKRQGSD